MIELLSRYEVREAGNGAVRAAAVDMFPGTANIESVVRLERTK